MSISSVPIRPRGMRAGRVVLLSMAAFVAVLVAVVWILPGMLDWNRYRSSIAGLVAAGIGRPVQIDGNITLHLLPQPFLTAADLKVNDTGDGAVMLVHEARLRVALGPLLAGRVDARELTLHGADLRLPWPLPAGAMSRRPPAWITGLQARVEESRLQIGDFVISDVDASLGADTDTGTLSSAGSAKLFNLPWRFTIRLGRPGRDGAAPLDVSLDGQGKLRDTGGTISGALEADGSLAGRVSARGPDLSQLLPAPAVAWRGDGRISAAAGLAVADELAFEIGGSPARGAVALRVQPDLRLDLALAAGRLDLDAWTPVLLRSAQPGKQPGVPTGIDLSAEVATLAGGTLRQVRTGFDIDADGVTVREATAILPGDAKLSLHGRFPNRGRTLSFDGAGELIAPNLHATLRWLEPVAPALIRALPSASLRTGNLSAKVAFDPAQLSFTDLKGSLDGAAVQGGLAVRLGPRLGVSAGLSLDRLLLEPWLPDAALLRDPASAYAGAVKAIAGAGFDADVKLQVQHADWRGASFGPVSVDMQSEAGHLTVRRLEATAMGVHATVSGTLGDAGRISEGRVELAVPDLSPLRAFMPAEGGRLAALLRGPANLLVLLAGPPDALGLRATLEIGDLRAEAQPVLNIPARRWTGPVMLHHPGAPRLLEQLGFRGTASWLGDGSLSLITQATVTPGRIELGNIELVAGSMRTSGQLALVGHVLQGRLKSETLTLPMVYPGSPDPLPLGALAGVDGAVRVDADQVLVDLYPVMTDLSADLEAKGGALGINGLSAKVAGGTVALSARISPGDLPHLTLQGQAENIDVSGPITGGPLDLKSGALQSTFTLAADGYSPAALVATLTGSGAVSVRDAVVTGLDVPAAQAALAQPNPVKLTDQLRAALTSGSTTFPQLDIPFEARGGVATLRATAAANPGSAALNGTLDLQGDTFDGRLSVQPGPGLPDLAVRLSGSNTTPIRTPELAGAARWLAERP